MTDDCPEVTISQQFCSLLASVITMNECAHDQNAAIQVGCILSYAGSTKDIIINYVLLVMNVSVCWLTLAKSDTERENEARRNHFPITGCASLVFVVLFQIALCLGLGCAGISIIWCACAGWIIYQIRSEY